MQRRRFLAQAAHRALAAGALTCTRWQAWAASDRTQPRLLVVFLRGGYDAMSLLAPTGSTFYREVRPHIALPATSAVSISPDWALHPAVEAALRPLLQARQVSFVPFAGTSDTSRSHFETQDFIELGQPAGNRNFRSGYLNRLMTVLHGPEAMAFTDELPAIFRGEADVPNQSLRGQIKGARASALQPALGAMYAHHPLGAKVKEGFDVQRDVMATLDQEMIDSAKGALGSDAFAQQARRMARLMRERYAVGFVDVGGWDTHVNQGSLDGNLGTRLGQLAQGLAAFAEDMGPVWPQTVVVVVSEFGRTLRENGNRGTDHGHGSVYWVLGGSLAGGPVHGDQVPIDASHLFQNRDLPVLQEHRDLMGGLLARQFGLSRAQLDSIFPGATPRDLSLL